MDISCPSCAEPWDTDYLCHDAIYDTDLYNTAEALCDAFHGKLDDDLSFCVGTSRLEVYRYSCAYVCTLSLL
jgi:hypothetical protein